jgi:hypothetical protein
MLKKQLHILILFGITSYMYAQNPGGISNYILWSKDMADEKAQVKEADLINFHKALKMDDQNPYKEMALAKLGKISLFMVFATDTKEVAKVQTGKGEITVYDDGVMGFNKKLDYKHTHGLPFFISYLTSFKRKRDIKNQDPKIIFGNKDNKGIGAKIAEVLVYDKVLSKDERKQVESYLSIKYGISLPEEADYLLSNGQVVFAGAKNKGYNYRVTGIGRDDKGALYQKQSKNVEDPLTLTIGLDKIYGLNDDNKSSLNDNSILFWSDDDADLSYTDNKGFGLLKRKWKLQTKDLSNREIEIKINPKAIQNFNPKLQNFLMVQTDGSGDFEKGNIYKVPLYKDKEGWLYTKFIFDKDMSGIDFITFGQANDIPIVEGRIGSNITINPNPVLAGTAFNINLNGSFSDLKITIYNESGLVVKSITPPLDAQEIYEIINVPGIYNLKFESKEMQEIKSIIVVR